MAAEKVILVGVDGSAQSMNAVDWAVDRAKQIGGEIHLVCAYSLPSFTASSLDGGYTSLDSSAIQEGAEAVIAEALERIKGSEVRATGKVEAGDPAGVLVELSEGASLVVVGTRGGGGFADRLLGTVSSSLPAHSHCPSVVVPVFQKNTHYTPVKRIVVGMDGSRSARRSLRWAIKEALLWGAELTAISAVPMASGAGILAWLPAAVDRDAVLDDVRAGLDAAIEAVVAEVPGAENLAIKRHALDGNAAALLAEFSTAVDLLVVGTRGRGGFAGLLLGSTSQAILNHSTCPVMVVPSHVEDADAIVPAWERP